MKPPLSWHPLWVTFCLLVLSVVPIPEDAWLLSAVLGVVGMLLWLEWAYQARAALLPEGTSKRRLLYALPVVCAVVVAIVQSTLPVEQRAEGSRLLRPTSIAEALALVIAIVAVAMYFSALWATASTINRAEQRRHGVNAWRTLIIFLSLALLPFSVWWLRPQVQRLMEHGLAKEHK